MERILNVINNLNGMRAMKPVTLKQIDIAQKELGVVFAEDYKTYVMHYGVISAEKVELTGISTVQRLDVVRVTQNERELNANIPDNAYVIENVGIDGIVMIQFTNGKIYSITMNGNLKLVCNSLTEYLENIC